MTTHEFTVGQQLAIYPSGSKYPNIRKIVSVSSSGRATLEGGIVIEPTLRIRGAQKWGPSHAHILTPEIQEQDDRYRIAHKLTHTNWFALSLINMKTIKAIIDLEKSGK